MKSRNSNIIDKKVFWSMAICAVISLAVLAFRIKSYEPCGTLEIFVKPGPLYVGELIQFKALGTTKQGNIQWELGAEKKDGIIINHTFKIPGRYEVNLNTETQCSNYKVIYVLEAPIIEDEDLKAIFTGPSTVEVGAPAIFEDATANATNWEWRFGETNSIDATTKKVTYLFKTPGPKTVILVVNDKFQNKLEVLVTPRDIKNPRGNGSLKATNNSGRDRKNRTMMIVEQSIPIETTKDAAVKIEKEQPRFPDVSSNELEALLVGIVEGTREISELTAYSCEGKAMQVTYNQDLVTLKKLQEELWQIKSKRKIRKIKITTKKDPVKNCIITMDISLKKKLL